ncbi:hypothetical protein SEVIR_7G250950v4 [Setaria viridis]|uniref:Uncharacterized protein n=1 Tax=Setaria viridis TaxID=4556 RepID=A0A4U6U059_SETVI|nr:uncharacterized protein LOC117863138 [Setaria viridis]TKW06609.1 hypothetical protein SEVIR_7G250950v2 [Setaria viridis]
MLTYNDGYSRVRIVSPTIRSIDVASGSGSSDLSLQQLIIEDATCLERLNQKAHFRYGKVMNILVISAPKLGILGLLYDGYPRLQIGTTVFQGLRLVTMTAVVRRVKVLALSNANLSLYVVLNIMRCFPCLEKLNIRTLLKGKKNVWGPKCRNLINIRDIHLKKLLLTNYEGSESHVNFVKFFVLKARVLESIRLELAFSLKREVPGVHFWILCLVIVCAIRICEQTTPFPVFWCLLLWVLSSAFSISTPLETCYSMKGMKARAQGCGILKIRSLLVGLLVCSDS